MPDVPPPSPSEVDRFLKNWTRAPVRKVSPIGAGDWSRAYSLETDDESLVLRIGAQEEDFQKDRIAASWQQPGLPVPRFIDMGQAFGAFYAITERAEGEFLDRLSQRDVKNVLPVLFRLLDAEQGVRPEEDAGYGIWDGHGVAPHARGGMPCCP